MTSRVPSALAAALTATLAVTMASHAAAQERPRSHPPETVAALSRCLPLRSDPERLACLDSAARAIDAAVNRGELLIVDRGQAAEARREAFGTNAAPADILQADRAEERIDAIETTLIRASQAGDGRWTFVLADGSVWTQVDTDRVRITNRTGEPVRVRRAALGSYMLVVGRSGAVRVRRR